MTLQEQCALSYYQPVADLNARHGISLVQHTETKKIFVRKILTVYDPDVYQYLREHPVRNTPRIYEAVEDGRTLTIIEDYLCGSTLQEVLRERGPLPEEEVCDLAIQLCRILRDLHQADPPIVHRDIKPSNLILSPDGVLKLLDMNAAKRVHRGTASDTHLIGTAGYAAPEQYGFAASDARTDIYAVGILMSELLTGEADSLPPESCALRPVVAQCTQLDPKDRYPDAGALEAALQGILSRQAGRRPEPEARPKPARRQLLPPGFRTGKIWKMLTAVIGYLLWLWLCSRLDVQPLTARFPIFLIGLGVIFFSANYLNLQSQLPFSRSRNWLVRLIGILLWDLIFVYLMLTLLTITGLLQ